MAKNDKKRQKKLEKKRMDRKAKQKSAAQLTSAAPQDRMRVAAQWPIYECVTMSFVDGATQIWISRRSPDGRLAEARYLVDTYAIGVKDVFCGISTSAQDWAESKASLSDEEVALLSCTPAYARKLVEQSVAYARTIGIEPPKAFAAAALLFGDIDASECTDEFTFGQDGKPLYVVGGERPEDILRWGNLVEAAGGSVSLARRPDLNESLEEEDFDDDLDGDYDDDLDDDFDDDGLIETEAVRHEPKSGN